MSCPVPHPTAANVYEGFDPRLEVIASESSDCFLHCTGCDTWFWMVLDDGRFQYWNLWELDRTLAARAARTRAPADFVRLLVRHNPPDGLPYGPIWTEAKWLVDLLAKLTRGGAPSEMSEALEAESPLPPRWSQALAWLRRNVAARARSFHASPYPFSADVALDLQGVDLWHESRDHLWLVKGGASPMLYQVSVERVVGHPLQGQPAYVGRRYDGACLISVDTPAGRGLMQIDPDGGFFTAEASAPLVAVASSALGWVLVERAPEGPRALEFRSTGLAPLSTLLIGENRRVSYVPTPKPVGEDWLVANAAPGGGPVRPLVLWRPGAGVIAQSEPGEPLVESVVAADPQTFVVHWSEPRPFGTLQIFSRDDAALVPRARLSGARTFRVVGDVVVAQVPDAKNALVAWDLSGAERWSFPVETPSVWMDPEADGLRVWIGERGVMLDPASGEVTVELGLAASPVPSDRHGTRYAVTDHHSVLVVSPDGRQREVFLDGRYEVQTTLGDAAVLSSQEPLLPDEKAPPRGRCVVVGGEGRVRGAFDAPGARWSVIGTHAGPYVIEPGRLRIGAFWAA
jgi:hypothetical protein